LIIGAGCGVGMEAFGSPICAHAIVPPLMTISGLAPALGTRTLSPGPGDHPQRVPQQAGRSRPWARSTEHGARRVWDPEGAK
jgi:hypothetical protein